MRRSRAVLSAVALVGAGTLLLSGCGGDDTGDDRIAGEGRSTPQESADPGPEPEPEGEESAGSEVPRDDIDRPEVTLPDYMNNVFEPAGTEEPAELAVITDAQHRRNAIDLAIDLADPEHEALAFYSARDGYVSDLSYVANAIDRGSTWSGTARFYDWQVEFDEGGDGGKALLTYCMDESRAYDKNRDTGEVTEREPSDADFVLLQERVERNGLGVWQNVHVTSERGAAVCRE
ncbi:hypothetical protein [Streptomyces sp. YIM 98790]|uniref:hypothetical protein n=1 Tax=Streptomyces sp. YIM 98790 TaxID=2689077 RepID=UPI00140A29DD|nr:hypothetical protein [Streptomyces sp. YIM 98790]